MLRICVDARLVSGTAGGVESAVIGLASGLSKLTDGEEEYLFLTCADADGWIRPYVSGRCRIVSGRIVGGERAWKKWLKARLPLVRDMYHKFSPLLGRRTITLGRSDGTIENAGVDIMHFASQWAFLTNVPSIYHPHDLQHLHLPEFFSPRVRLVREVVYRAFCKQARMVAVASSWGKRDLIQHYGLPENKVQVVPLAPVLTAYPTPSADDLEAARRKFFLPETFGFYPAQTWAHKNHIGLLEALAILRDRHGLKVRFVCAGHRTGFFVEIERLVRKLRLVDRVSFLGFVNPLELQCLYRLCRCVVIPTQFEAASGPLWEAFLAGAPAACSNVTSLPDQAGDAALLFTPGNPEKIADAIVRLWTDEALRKMLVARGRKKVASFTWDHTARTFRAHYRRIAGVPLTDEDRALIEAPPLL